MITPYFKTYVNQLDQAFDSIDTSQLQKFANVMVAAAENNRTIFVCGNGGSAAIADHLACDCLKGIRSVTHLKPKVVSLCSNGPLVSAIANDYGYQYVFSYQLESLMQSGDVLITISSSGNSENIREAINFAKTKDYTVISMCGFDGGASLKANIPIHVKAHNYGIVEDVHQAIMHLVSQYIRIENVKPGIRDLNL
jgi:D-sedoheptulose 7-phosphate isomerase